LVTNDVTASIMILLIQENTFSAQPLKKLCLCKHLLYNQKLESLLFIPYIEGFSYVFPDSTLAKYWTIYFENLILNLPDDVTFLLVTVPKQYGSATVEKIMEFAK